MGQGGGASQNTSKPGVRFSSGKCWHLYISYIKLILSIIKIFSNEEPETRVSYSINTYMFTPIYTGGGGGGGGEI